MKRVPSARASPLARIGGGLVRLFGLPSPGELFSARKVPMHKAKGFYTSHILAMMTASLCAGCVGVTSIKGNLVWQGPSGQSIPLTPDRCEGQTGWLDLSSTKTGSHIHYVANAWDGPEVEIMTGNAMQT